MDKPKGYKNSIDYAQFVEDNKEEILRSAADAIDPALMGMTRKQAMALGAAMKGCGFSREDYAAVLAKDPNDKGTFSSERQWKKWSKDRAGAGTIILYAKLSGWKWPRPPKDGEQTETSKKAKPQQPARLANMARWRDDFKLVCIMDSEEYGYKLPNNRVGEIRRREQSPTPAPEPMSIAEFAEAVTSGRTFSPTVYDKQLTGYDKDGKPEYYYKPVCQQVFIADIDNEKSIRGEDGKNINVRIDNPLTIEAALQICKEHELEPFLVYETFSSKKHREDPAAPYQKFRLCFATDEPLTAQEYGARGIKDVVKYIIGLFGKAADDRTADPARLIFGTDEKLSVIVGNHIVDREKLFAAAHAPKDSANDPDEKTGTDEKEAQDETAAPDETAAENPDKEETEPLKPVGGFIETFKQHRLESKQNVRTGFKSLDIALGGGFGNELYIMGAETGTGKSAIASVLAQNMAAAGVDVLYYALEMGRDEFIARGASAISAEGGIASQKAIKYGEMLNDTYDPITDEFYRRPYTQYASYVEEYARRYGEHLYIIEGGTAGAMAKDIKDQALIFKQSKGVSQLVVFVDYLQLLKADPEDSAQRDFMGRMSAAVTILKTLASQAGVSVFVISSMANDRKGQRVNDASFKYSGDIGYTGGVLLGWNWNGVTNEKDEAKRKEAITNAKKLGYREMIFEVLKQRSLDRDAEIKLLYYPAYNYIVDGMSKDFISIADTPDILKDTPEQPQAPDIVQKMKQRTKYSTDIHS